MLRILDPDLEGMHSWHQLQAPRDVVCRRPQLFGHTSMSFVDMLEEGPFQSCRLKRFLRQAIAPKERVLIDSTGICFLAAIIGVRFPCRLGHSVTLSLLYVDSQ